MRMDTFCLYSPSVSSDHIVTWSLGLDEVTRIAFDAVCWISSSIEKVDTPQDEIQ